MAQRSKKDTHKQRLAARNARVGETPAPEVELAHGRTPAGTPILTRKVLRDYFMEDFGAWLAKSFPGLPARPYTPDQEDAIVGAYLFTVYIQDTTAAQQRAQQEAQRQAALEDMSEADLQNAIDQLDMQHQAAADGVDNKFGEQRKKLEARLETVKNGEEAMEPVEEPAEPETGSGAAEEMPAEGVE